MKNKIILSLVIFLMSFCTNNAWAQTSNYKEGDLVKIGLKNGLSFTGYIQSYTEEEIILKIPEAGVMTIYTEHIGASNKLSKAEADRKFVEKVNTKEEYSQYKNENPLYSKYYIGESAIGLKEGQGYYQNILIIGNFFAYGITDNFSLSGGFESISLVLGEVPIFFINPKFSIHNETDNLHFAVGAFTGIYGQRIETGGVAGSLYGTVTIGDTNNNFSGGLGLGFGGDGILNSPIIQMAGMTRLSERIGFVGELLLTNVGSAWEGGLTLNVRIMSEKTAFDIGIFYVEGTNPFPVGSAAIRF